MRERTRAKGLAAARELTVGLEPPIAYGIGVEGPNPRAALALLVAGTVVVVAVTAVVSGAVFVPGLLFFFVVSNAVNRPDGLAVNSTSLVVLSKSWATGKPTAVKAVVTLAALGSAEPAGAYVRLASVGLWMRTKEHRRLCADAAPWLAVAAPALGVADAAPGVQAAPGWYPFTGDPTTQGYWDGARWTVRRSWDGTAYRFAPIDPPS